jgi:hypothetical protein
VQDYPGSASALPVVDIEGPLGAHDPARTALQEHLEAVAAEQQEELAGSGGYIWQLVLAAKEWINENIPPDIATRKAGQFASTTDGAAAVLGSNGDTASSGAAAGAAGVGSSGGSLPWWEREDVDLQLVMKATEEAAAAHWASWSVNDEGNPWGSDDEEAAAAAGLAASTASSAEALASAGDGVRGRWDYIIGLVGKPSAGKSTFFNAVTGKAGGWRAAPDSQWYLC